MSSDYKGRRAKKNLTLLSSFRHAACGFRQVLKEERNIKIHVLLAFVACCLGLYCRLSHIEWAILSLTIGGVIALEIINSAIERAVDLTTVDYHPLAKAAKDMAAAAVTFFAFIAIVIACLVILPKLLAML